VLIPTTIGSPAALWAARESVMLVDDLGALAVIPSHMDAGIPIARRRFAHHAGSRLTLPTGRSTTLASGLRITGGSVVFEGTSIALIAEHARGRDIVVLALASGCPLQTVGLPPGTVRIAARRGLAVVHDAARRLAIIDLRSARPLGAVMAGGDVTDVAVDPDGSLLAIRLASGDLQIAPIDERMGAATRLSTSLRGAGDRDVYAPRPAPADAAVLGRSSDVRPPEPRAAALVKLDREIRSITLWALRAILNPCDTHRLGHGNEAHPHEHEVALAADPQHRSASAPVAELAGEAGAVADRDRRVACDRGAVAPRRHRAAAGHPRQRPRPSAARRAARRARPR